MKAPLCRTHDISQDGYHIKDLHTFGEVLTSTAAGAIPNGKSRYKGVYVLLVSWLDDNLGVVRELTLLKKVFDEVRNKRCSESGARI